MKISCLAIFASLLLGQTVVSAEHIGLGDSEDPYIEQGSFSLILFIYETRFCQFVHLNSEQEMFRGILRYFSFYMAPALPFFTTFEVKPESNAKRFLCSLGWPTVEFC